jgi:hypothetical protein
MNIGKIISIEAKWAKVELAPGEFAEFNVGHQSVVHGHKFTIGDEVSLRFSRDNSRVVSVVPASPTP